VTYWSQLQATVPQKGEAEVGVTPDAIEALVGKPAASSMVSGHRLANSLDLRLPQINSTGNPNVTLKELMTTIGHSSPIAALRYQHATAERGQEIARYLDDVVEAAQSTPETASVPLSS
jgi:hypothetical protein